MFLCLFVYFSFFIFYVLCFQIRIYIMKLCCVACAQIIILPDQFVYNFSRISGEYNVILVYPNRLSNLIHT